MKISKWKHIIFGNKDSTRIDFRDDIIVYNASGKVWSKCHGFLVINK